MIIDHAARAMRVQY